MELVDFQLVVVGIILGLKEIGLMLPPELTEFLYLKSGMKTLGKSNRLGCRYWFLITVHWLYNVVNGNKPNHISSLTTAGQTQVVLWIELEVGGNLLISLESLITS